MANMATGMVAPMQAQNGIMAADSHNPEIK